MNEIKKPYRITLWEDRNIYIVNGQKKRKLNSGDIVQNQYLEEVCLATIGSDTMDNYIRAFNPILTEDLNGSKTLTFQIFYRYWDDIDEEFKVNPFIRFLVNERKIKLYYNDEWYDFIIKQCQENSEDNIFTYTCKDLFINELGKTGYDIILDTELYNNMGTVTELADTILQGTDWKVDKENSDHLIQKNKEMLYEYTLTSQIVGRDMLNSENQITINSGQKIYIFYSCKTNDEEPVQFLYRQNGYKVDSDGFIINSENWELFSGSFSYENVTILSQYFGKKIVKNQQIKNLPQIGEVCSVYTSGNNKYYCYKDFEYASVTDVQNLINNNNNFTSTDGWTPENDGTLMTLSYFLDSPGTSNVKQFPALSITGESSLKISNSGLYDNRASFYPKGLVKGEYFDFLIRTDLDSIDSVVLEIKGDIILEESGLQTIDLPFEEVGHTDHAPGSFFDFSDRYKYAFIRLRCTNSISYQELLKYLNIKIILTIPSCKIVDIMFFKEIRDINGKLIVPNLSEATESIIKTRYNFFPYSTDLTTINGKDDIVLSSSLLEGSSTLNNYHPVMVEGYEKVTSITGSKSNRFNLIQSLCEAFECWAKFNINHDARGRILYNYIPINSSEFTLGEQYYYRTSGSGASSDDSLFTLYRGNQPTIQLYKKVYEKNIIFKEYIGDDNWVGFHYGINLKSIQRNIISDQIASKVIIEENSNEYAPNGSCTIQQAKLNPTGDTSLYNFQYFINQELLSKESLYNDLYGTNNGLGFYSKMRAYNDELDPIREKIIKINGVLDKLLSQKQLDEFLLENARDLYETCRNNIEYAGYDPDVSWSNYYQQRVRDNIIERDNLATSIEVYGNELNLINQNLNEYSSILSNLERESKTIIDEKNVLNNTFEKKYYRFIQEGTWTSNDYYDPDLYYQAANQVLYTSSFPQVSYTINVLEISQVDGYENYNFKIADKTYIEDVEFFGYDSAHRPYKEEVVISQVKSNLDDPSQNTLTIQNYKTQFQDLFQRIAATSQTLQYKEGDYNRAAKAINANKTINSVLLQNSMKANELIIQNAKNQSVVWDETGITISNTKSANEIVRLTSNGIVLTVDGGQSWTTGITGKGINADVITTGTLNTNLIKIFNGNIPTFEWNPHGLNAYSINYDGTVNFNKFVRFDQYGLYGYNGVEEASEYIPGSLEDVINDSLFSLTWKGLYINLPQGQGWIKIYTVPGDTRNPYSLSWYEKINNEYIQTQDTIVNQGKNYYKNECSSDIIINVNNRFKVFGDGHLEATSGQFNGSVVVGTDSIIDWDSVTQTGTIPYTPAGQSVTLPDYIKSTYIDFTAVTSPYIKTTSFVLKNSSNNSWLNLSFGSNNTKVTFNTISGASFYFSKDCNITGNCTVSSQVTGESYRILKSSTQTLSATTTTVPSGNSTGTNVLRSHSSNLILITEGKSGGTDSAGTFRQGDIILTARAKYGADYGCSTLMLTTLTEDYNAYAYFYGSYNSTSGWHDRCTVQAWHFSGYAFNNRSDRRLKTNISYDLSKYDNFIKRLNPCSFEFKNDLGKTNVGYIAQDIEEALLDSELSLDDLNIITKTYNEKEEEIYCLNYSTFIPLQQYQIQKLENKVTELENRITALENFKN